MEANVEKVLKNMRETIGDLAQQLAVAKTLIEQLQEKTTTNN